MTHPDDKSRKPLPHDYDRNTADHVEKKPARERGGEDSPQQTHDDEDQG